MLRAGGVAFVKALSAARVSPVLLNLLRRAVVERKRARRTAVTAGERGPEESVFSHRSLHQHAGKRRAAEMAGSGGSSEPAAGRP